MAVVSGPEGTIDSGPLESAPAGLAACCWPTGRNGVVWLAGKLALGSVLGWGEPLGIAPERATDRCGRRWSGVMKADVVREGQAEARVAAPQCVFMCIADKRNHAADRRTADPTVPACGLEAVDPR